MLVYTWLYAQLIVIDPQGLFLADFIAVIRSYSQCQKVSFFPIFGGKFPISSHKKIQKQIIDLWSKSWPKIVCTACVFRVPIHEN